MMRSNRNFRKRILEHEDDPNTESGDEDQRRSALEEVKFLQRQRERKPGIPALPTLKSSSSFNSSSSLSPSFAGGLHRPNADKACPEDNGEDLVLQDTFAQETAVTVEDPNMLKYVEQELAKRRGKRIDEGDKEADTQVDQLYIVPEHLKVKKRNSEESSTQWTTGIAEVQLPIEYKLRNIEETEAAKKLLQDKRLVGRAKSELSIPSSYSADYFHRGRDYAEKLRREHPELYKGQGAQVSDAGTKSTETNNPDVGGRRQAASDEFTLERFRKRERHRVMRR